MSKPPSQHVARAKSPRRNPGAYGDSTPKVTRKGWGGVARKGASTMLSPEDAVRKRRDENPPEFEPTPSAKWIKEQPPVRSKKPINKPESIVSSESLEEVRRIGGLQGDRMARYFKQAATAYAADRFADALRALRVCLADIPDAPSVRELHGLILYRQGKWKAAAKVLRDSHHQTASFDIYPALMDCERALENPVVVLALWDELRKASPSAEIVAEGRIVYAGMLRDEGRFADAIRVLEKAPRAKHDPEPYHLRTQYVLADAYEQVGNIAKARQLFGGLLAKDADFADVAERLAELE